MHAPAASASRCEAGDTYPLAPRRDRRERKRAAPFLACAFSWSPTYVATSDGIQAHLQKFNGRHAAMSGEAHRRGTHHAPARLPRACCMPCPISPLRRRARAYRIRMHIYIYMYCDIYVLLIPHMSRSSTYVCVG